MSDWNKHLTLESSLVWEEVKAALAKLVTIHGNQYDVGNPLARKKFFGHELTQEWVRRLVEYVEDDELQHPKDDLDDLNERLEDFLPHLAKEQT